MPGERWVLVLSRGDDQTYSTSNCTLNGRLGTPSGDELLALAIDTFGDPTVPATAEPEAPAPIDLEPWLGGLGWVVAVVGAGVLLLGVVAFVARRRPTD